MTQRRRSSARNTDPGRAAQAPLLIRKVSSSTPLAAAVLMALRAPSPAFAQEQAQPQKPSGLEEITVTATRREMNLQDVPQSIAAFSTEDIEKQAFQGMEDYVKSLASTNLVSYMPGRNTLIMRGVTTSATDYRTDSQVSVYLDDQPITSASQQPDLRMIDIERIESLPGPQGTLFGSSSQSGTLHIITNKPDTHALSGQLDSEVATTKGGEPSYDLSGHINVPIISDTLAIRLVGYYSHEGGYVDNILGTDLESVHVDDEGNLDDPRPASVNKTNSDLVEDDWNDYDTYGGRLSVLWNISENWTTEFTFLQQWSDADGSWDSDPALGDYKVTRFYDEWRDDNWYQTALSANGDLGFATLTTAVSYFDRDSSYSWDNTLYEQWKTAYFGTVTYYEGTAYEYVRHTLYDVDFKRGFQFNDQHQDRWTAEVRLTSQGEGKLHWLAGTFYEDVYDTWLYGARNPSLMQTPSWDVANAYAAYYANYYPFIHSPLEPTDFDYSNLMRRTVKQTAVFGEMTYDFTKRFSATFGTRWFEFDRDQFDQFQYPQGLPPAGGYDNNGIYTSGGRQSDTVYKLGAQFHIDDDRMLYAIYSEGFRLGGSNSPRAAQAGFGIPAEYDPDTMKNYELGFKSTWLDNRLSFNIDYFLMHWDDIQLYARVTNPDGADPWWLRGIFNGKTAEQKGVELSTSWQATDRLKLDASAYFADPQFTATTVYPRGDIIEDGQTMPDSPKRKWWWAAEYTVPGAFGLDGNLWFRYDTSYQSSTYTDLDSALARDPNGLLPSWNSANLQAGLSLNSGWDVSLIARNVWDEANVTWLSSTFWTGPSTTNYTDDNRFNYVRTLEKPRTIGLQVRKKFQ
jgi:outer membrane receptor protein involved in Fe transport